MTSILDLLKTLNTAEDRDNLFVTAGAINLYNESIRRIRGQVLYSPEDVRSLLTMMECLLGKPNISEPSAFAKAPRRKLTEAEEDQLLKAVEDTVDEVELLKRNSGAN